MRTRVLYALLYVALLGSVQGARRKKPQGRIYLKYELLENCKEYKLQNFIKNVTFNYSNGAINLVYVVNQPDPPPKVMMSFYCRRCKSIHDTNCEHFVGGVMDFCKILVDKGQYYSPTFSAFRPRMKCPVKQGTYRMVNATLSLDNLRTVMKYIPDEYYQSYWNLKFKVFAPGKPHNILTCINVMFKAAHAKV